MKQNLFNSVKMTKPGKNSFDLSHDVKFSCNMGQLIPIMAMECVPGDQVSLGCESLIRFAPLVAPVMHQMNVSTHDFFVPNRILWENWEAFITNSPNLMGAGPISFPTVQLTQAIWDAEPLYDYMGVPRPSDPVAVFNISALPFAAYQKVVWEYYRDQNLMTPALMGFPEAGPSLVDGDNNTLGQPGLPKIRNRAWEHDYFTAALPFAQKGPSVDIPLGEIELNPDWASGPAPHMVNTLGIINSGAMTSQASPTPYIAAGATSNGAQAYDPNGSLEVNATTINDLRRAFRLQEWLEKNARGGTRYTENILAHFGVRSSDQRMQRPEYITGTKSPVVISEVVNTAGDGDLPQGNLAGHGVSVTSGKYGKYFCEEHGYIIRIMSVIPRTAYQQGIPKHFLKTIDPFQYYWPSFAHIGEQEITNDELYIDANAPKDTFGYIPRYSEYKYMPSRVAGDFRTSLNYWHLGRIFQATPMLNADFVTCQPSHRIFAVEDPTEQKLYCHVLNKVKAVRPMPVYGTPTF